MPTEYRVDEKTGIIHIRRWGEITTHDEEVALRKRSIDPSIGSNIPVIVDCREVEPPDSSEIV